MQLIDAKLKPINKKLERMKSNVTTLKQSLNDHVSKRQDCYRKGLFNVIIYSILTISNMSYF